MVEEDKKAPEEPEEKEPFDFLLGEIILPPNDPSLDVPCYLLGVDDQTIDCLIQKVMEQNNPDEQKAQS